MPKATVKRAAGAKPDKRSRPALRLTSVKRTVGLITEFYPRLIPAVCALILFSSAVSAIGDSRTVQNPFLSDIRAWATWSAEHVAIKTRST